MSMPCAAHPSQIQGASQPATDAPHRASPQRRSLTAALGAFRATGQFLLVRKSGVTPRSGSMTFDRYRIAVAEFIAHRSPTDILVDITRLELRIQQGAAALARSLEGPPAALQRRPAGRPTSSRAERGRSDLPTARRLVRLDRYSVLRPNQTRATRRALRDSPVQRLQRLALIRGRSDPRPLGLESATCCL
jgi:hypothetical protein